ncbi:hypothetical protein HF329_11795 [Chitinophaga oryzae]|uniref:Uncharacterized protein n=1 Tax=Chitinophaga oryzae TaxID=2725414 RepID=A0AAE6ZHN6_9BACT|nr:hypothetical protein [Chitinophaga oryzae]QJB31974.1 hypothetical protein HF329_11795 [Chitinophaga oryzae]
MKKFSICIGLLLVAVGIPVFLFSGSVNAELPLLIGLFTLFISNQAKEDERSGAIRSSSAFIALVIGYSLHLVMNNLFQHQLIAIRLTTVNSFLIIVFALANIIRYSRLYIFMV